MTKFKRHVAAAAIGFALIATFTPVSAATAAPDGPAPIETGSEPRDVGEPIDDASGPRATVTDDTPDGAGVLPQSGSSPRKVGAEPESGSGPRPVGKPIRVK